MPERIQRKRTAGWRMPKGAIYVGRPSRWGNPFAVGGGIPDMPNIYGPISGRTGITAAEAVEAYRRYAPLIFVPVKPSARPYRGIYTHGIESLPQHARRVLVGHDLACWCPLDQPCHADVLLEIANQTTTKEG
ncbi:DUF4326 domain-containing protein [Mycobacteroides abscessus]|uniref:DUF4326 domain-containing protein n=1 Tax=Mycobacteroides abscessus TaxID=36809 RepID=UPI0009A890C8|nr:DUF4326 domain-containing protein [Mycobacteroides abscessus]SLG54033.1 Uncharacterised protein [Mycobacteroides abscessus subsp. massiliense]